MNACIQSQGCSYIRLKAVTAQNEKISPVGTIEHGAERHAGFSSSAVTTVNRYYYGAERHAGFSSSAVTTVNRYYSPKETEYEQKEQEKDP